MTSTDPLAMLAAANPVPELPNVAPFEHLACLREKPQASAPTGRERSRGRIVGPASVVWRRRSIVLAASVLSCACAAGLVLAGGSSGPGVDVAAAAYQASSPGAGVLEADFVDRLYGHGRLVAVVQRREWIGASQGSQRTQQRTQRIGRPAGHGCASVILETASAPRHEEFASGAKACPRPLSGRGGVPGLGVIHRFELARPRPQEAGGAVSESPRAIYRQRVSRELGARPRVTPPPEIALGAKRDNCRCFSLTQAFQGDASPLETEGLSLYRRLYREGVIRLVGPVRIGGRLLWKLEAVVGWTSTNTRAGRLVPVEGLVVLVDPTTFHPVVEQEVNLALPGHPVTVESQLVSYRRLPRNATSEALLQISAQHPGLRVITVPTHFPHTVFRQR
jgi:hypothetical protein